VILGERVRPGLAHARQNGKRLGRPLTAALRTKDNTVTIMVINKTYGPLNAMLTVNNLTATTTSAQAYLHSNANVAATVSQRTATVTPPAQGSAASAITTSFPAQSITLLVMPN
jgi:hypothetical protein